MNKFFNFKRDENGSTIILTILIIFLLCGMGGFAVDASYLYRTKGEMRKAANAAALSGAQLLYTDTSTTVFRQNAEAMAEDIVDDNNQGDCDSIDADTPAMPNNLYNKVTVTLQKDVTPFFMKIFGVTNVPITVTSSAIKDVEIDGMGGIRPLGINKDSLPLKVGTKYLVKDDNKMEQQGWFGWIDIGQGNSASGALDYMNNGCPNTINLGDIVNVAPGNMASVSSKANLPMTVPILIYEKITSGKKVTFKVTGFAIVKLTSPAKKEVYAEFIKTVNLNSNTGLPSDFRAFNTRLVK